MDNSKNNTIILYNKKNINSIKGLILINIREQYILHLVKKIIEYNIIPLEYITEKLRLEYINKGQNFIINDDIIFKFILKLFTKEITIGTSKLISELCL